MTHIYEANVTWNGALNGEGMLKSAGLEALFSVPSEFKGKGVGTNPEELLGLTAASCYAITIAAVLSFQGITVKKLSVRTSVEVYFDKGLELKKLVHYPKVVAANATVQKIAESLNRAKESCFFSKALNKSIAVEVQPEINVESI